MKNAHFILLITSILLFSCNTTPEQQEPEVSISNESIFNLDSKWLTEENKEIMLKDLQGQTLVVAMIYTSCEAACPILLADMQNIASKIPTENQPFVRYVLVSIDPSTDTPQHLKAFAIANQMDGENWSFLQGDEKSIRELANVLSVKYKQIEPMDFSHSNIITVVDQNGIITFQQEGLGTDNTETIGQIIQVTKKAIKN